MEIGPGTRVSEYVLESKLGEGAFGTVWKAVHHLWKDRVVAVKIPRDKGMLDELRREGLIQHYVEKLDDAHIVKTLGIDTDADPPYFIMEFVDGTDLRKMMREKGRIEPVKALDLSLQILKALGHAHSRGVVHCDLKPENILVDREGRVKISDFGLGQRTGPESPLLLSDGLDDDAKGAGTMEYMAPEQRKGARNDPKADLYSFGVILFEMITGERPQPGDMPGDLAPAAPKIVDVVFRKCFVRAEKRFSSAAEIAALLEEGADGAVAAPAQAEAPAKTPASPASAPAQAPSPQAAVPGRAAEPAAVIKAPERATAQGVREAAAEPPRPAKKEDPSRGMILVPAGEFLMGSPDPASDSYPEHKRQVPDFLLDAVPVVNARFLEFVRNGGYGDRKFWGEDGAAEIEKYVDSTGKPGPRYWANGAPPAGLDAHPVVGVSFFEARAYARWAGKRLPSEEEWEKAARGADGRAYPWGGPFDRKLCNTQESGYGATTKAGRFSAGKSPYGALDMAGNVLEWTRSFFEPYPGNERENPQYGRMYRVLRGGAWCFKQKSAETSMRFIMRPDLRWNYVGFRCAKDA